MNLSQQQRKDDEKLVVENSLRRRSVEKSLTPSYLDDEEDGWPHAVPPPEKNWWEMCVEFLF